VICAQPCQHSKTFTTPPLCRTPSGAFAVDGSGRRYTVRSADTSTALPTIAGKAVLVSDGAWSFVGAGVTVTYSTEQANDVDNKRIRNVYLFIG